MKKFLILLLVCLMVACNKPQTENKQEEVPPQKTQQTEQPKVKESPKPVPQVDIVSQTEENEKDDEEQISEETEEDLEEMNEDETEDEGSCPRRNYTPLCKAIRAENLKAVKKLIKEGGNINIADTCTYYGCEGEFDEDSALTLAIKIGNLEIVKELIKAGVDVNKENHSYEEYAGEGGDDFYYNPLYLATIQEEKKDIAEELLKAGADVNAIDGNGKGNNGKTILELTDDPEITQMLLKYGAKDTPLAAFVRNDLDKFKTLLKTASQGEKDEALIKTVQDNNISAVQELIKAGADINVNIDINPYPYAGCTEGTPLSVAIGKEYTEIAALLKEYGAKDDICAAMESQDLQRIKQVIQQGIDLNKEYGVCEPFDCYHRIPINSAIIEGNVELVKEFIKAGANVNGTFVTPPLYKAVSMRNTDIIKILLDAGADVNIKGIYNDETVFDYAKKTGNTEIIELLKSAGAKE